MNRLDEPEFHGLICEQAVTPFSVPFWGCGAGQGSDFGSSATIKFWSATWAGLVVNHVNANGLVSTTKVDDGGFAHFDSGGDFRVGDACISKEEDSGSFDGSDVGVAFAGECGELRALFAG